MEVDQPTRWSRGVRAMAIALGTAVLATLMVAFAPQVRAAENDPSTPCDDEFAATGGRSIPPRPQTVVQIESTGPICELEQQIIAEIAASRGLPLTPHVRKEILSYGRGVVRAALLARLSELAFRPLETMTDVERGALAWSDARVRAFRIKAAEIAVAEYAKWEADPCAYLAPPPFDYVSGRTMCGDQAAFVNAYVGGPQPPTLLEFVLYGLVEANATVFTEQNAAPSVDFALATVALAILGPTDQVLTTLFNKTARKIVLPHRSRKVVKKAAQDVSQELTEVLAKKITTEVVSEIGEGAAKAVFRVVSKAIGAYGGPVGLLIELVIELALGLADIAERERIPHELDALLDVAQFPPPNLTRTILLNPDQNRHLPVALFDATLPDHGPDPSVQPAAEPPPSAAWFRIDPVGTSGVTTYSQKLRYDDPVDGAREAWLKDRWWVTQPADRSSPPVLTPALRMTGPLGGVAVTYDGAKFSAQRLAEDAASDCPGKDCAVANDFSFGLRSTSADDPVLLHAKATLSGAKPTGASVQLAGGELFEDTPVSFRASGSDPGGEPVKYLWDILRDGQVIRSDAGQQIVYIFAQPGQYTIRMRVTDPTGLYDEALLPVAIGGEPPRIEISTIDQRPEQSAPSPQPLMEGPPTAAARIRAQGEPGLLVELDIDNNGTYEQTGTVADGATSIDFPSPGFPDEGRYPIGVRVTKSGLAPVIDTVEITVRNVGPVVAASLFERSTIVLPDGSTQDVHVPIPSGGGSNPTVIAEGTTVEGTFEASDPGDDEFEVNLSWADGTNEVMRGIRDGQLVSFSHTFTDDSARPRWPGPGPEPPFFGGLWPGLQVVAVDEDKGLSNLTTFFLDVENVRPAIEAVSINVIGEEALAQVTVTDIAPGDVESVLVDFGDGSEPVEMERALPPEGNTGWNSASYSVRHVFESAGRFRASFVATDDNPEDAVEVVRNAVTRGPPPAIGRIDRAHIGGRGRPSNLAVEVLDLDNGPGDVALVVDWGDGTTTEHPYDPAAEIYPAAHAYQATGLYDVTLSSRDANGNEVDFPEVFQAEVTNLAPTIEVDPLPASIPEGSDLVVSGTVTSDDGSRTDVDWGDGSSESGQPEIDGTFSLGHTYPDDGTHTVTVTPVDGYDLAGTPATHQLTVSNIAPTITGISTTVGALPGETVTANVAFTDPGADTHTVGVAWGDGSTSGPVPPAPLGHVYATPGSYQVTVTVTDDDGGSVTGSTSVVMRTLAAGVTDLISILVSAKPGAPPASRATIDKALKQLDGPGNGDALGALARGDRDLATEKLNNALALLEQAKRQGADVQAGIDLLRRVLESLLAS